MSTENHKISDNIASDHLLKTGEFARLSNLNRDTLSFYIKKKLITPVYIGENKYKYFSPDQVQTVQMIKYLRRCLMPLDSIREILSNPSTDHLQHQIRKQRDDLEEQIRLLREASGFVNESLREKNLFDSLSSGETQIRISEPRKAFIYPVQSSSFFQEHDDPIFLSDLSRMLNRHMPDIPFVFRIFFSSESPDHVTPADNAISPGESFENEQNLPDGTCLMMRADGCPKDTEAYFSALQKQAEEEGYIPERRFADLLIEDRFALFSQAEQRMLLSVRIKEKTETAESAEVTETE